jgi:two-component sensor histidine kinase
VELRTIIEAELAAHQDRQRKVEIQGPTVSLAPNAAQVFALALHELTTNAVKYGALSRPTGKLTVRWRLDEDDPTRPLVLEWQESGVPIVPDAPRRKGYGTELIERALTYQVKAKTRLEFGADGVFCSITLQTGVNEGGRHG